MLVTFLMWFVCRACVRRRVIISRLVLVDLFVELKRNFQAGARGYDERGKSDLALTNIKIFSQESAINSFIVMI